MPLDACPLAALGWTAKPLPHPTRPHNCRITAPGFAVEMDVWSPPAHPRFLVSAVARVALFADHMRPDNRPLSFMDYCRDFGLPHAEPDEPDDEAPAWGRAYAMFSSDCALARAWWALPESFRDATGAAIIAHFTR